MLLVVCLIGGLIDLHSYDRNWTPFDYLYLPSYHWVLHRATIDSKSDRHLIARSCLFGQCENSHQQFVVSESPLIYELVRSSFAGNHIDIGNAQLSSFTQQPIHGRATFPHTNNQAQRCQREERNSLTETRTFHSSIAVQWILAHLLLSIWHIYSTPGGDGVTNAVRVSETTACSRTVCVQQYYFSERNSDQSLRVSGQNGRK